MDEDQGNRGRGRFRRTREQEAAELLAAAGDQPAAQRRRSAPGRYKPDHAVRAHQVAAQRSRSNASQRAARQREREAAVRLDAAAAGQQQAQPPARARRRETAARPPPSPLPPRAAMEPQPQPQPMDADPPAAIDACVRVVTAVALARACNAAVVD